MLIFQYKSRIIRNFFLIISLITASPVCAGGSGGDLNKGCNDRPGTPGDLICDTYINAFVNGIIIDQVAREQGRSICIPDHTSTAQIREVIKNWSKDHPDTLQFDSGPFVGGALAKAYPCTNLN